MDSLDTCNSRINVEKILVSDQADLHSPIFSDEIIQWFHSPKDNSVTDQYSVVYQTTVLVHCDTDNVYIHNTTLIIATTTVVIKQGSEIEAQSQITGNLRCFVILINYHAP